MSTPASIALGREANNTILPIRSPLSSSVSRASPPRSRTPTSLRAAPPPSPYSHADDDRPSPTTSPPGSPFPYPSPPYSPISPVYYHPVSPVYSPTSTPYSPTSPGGLRWLWPSFSPTSTLDAPRTPSPTSPGYDGIPRSPSGGPNPNSPFYSPSIHRERERTPQPPASPEYCYGCSTPLEDCCCPEARTAPPRSETAAAEHVTPSPPRSPAF